MVQKSPREDELGCMARIPYVKCGSTMNQGSTMHRGEGVSVRSGIRITIFVHFARLESGKKCQRRASLIDLYPSFITIA